MGSDESCSSEMRVEFVCRPGPGSLVCPHHTQPYGATMNTDVPVTERLASPDYEQLCARLECPPAAAPRENRPTEHGRRPGRFGWLRRTARILWDEGLRRLRQQARR